MIPKRLPINLYRACVKTLLLRGIVTPREARIVLRNAATRLSARIASREAFRSRKSSRMGSINRRKDSAGYTLATVAYGDRRVCRRGIARYRALIIALRSVPGACRVVSG